jgi:hypothetical protein
MHVRPIASLFCTTPYDYYLRDSVFRSPTDNHGQAVLNFIYYFITWSYRTAALARMRQTSPVQVTVKNWIMMDRLQCQRERDPGLLYICWRLCDDTLSTSTSDRWQKIYIYTVLQLQLLAIYPTFTLSAIDIDCLPEVRLRLLTSSCSSSPLDPGIFEVEVKIKRMHSYSCKSTSGRRRQLCITCTCMHTQSTCYICTCTNNCSWSIRKLLSERSVRFVRRKVQATANCKKIYIISIVISLKSIHVHAYINVRARWCVRMFTVSVA